MKNKIRYVEAIANASMTRYITECTQTEDTLCSGMPELQRCFTDQTAELGKVRAELHTVKQLNVAAEAKAVAIKSVAQAIQSHHGMGAFAQKIAVKYVEAFGIFSKENNTIILPGSNADMGPMVAAMMDIWWSQQ